MPPPKLAPHFGRDGQMQALPESIREWASGRVGFLDSMINAQEPDVVWGKDMMGVVRAAFKSFEGASVESLECGQTLCRLELLPTTKDDFGPQKAQIALAKVAPANGEQTVRTSAPPAEPKIVVYMTRENTHLPSPFDRIPFE